VRQRLRASYADAVVNLERAAAVHETDTGAAGVGAGEAQEASIKAIGAEENREAPGNPKNEEGCEAAGRVMGALSQLHADVAQAERLKPVRAPMSDDEHFLKSVILLPSDRMASLVVELMDTACKEDSATTRGEIGRKLLILDEIGKFKFDRWVSLRRGST